jgi:hypothetical protein
MGSRCEGSIAASKKKDPGRFRKRHAEVLKECGRSLLCARVREIDRVITWLIEKGTLPKIRSSSRL